MECFAWPVVGLLGLIIFKTPIKELFQALTTKVKELRRARGKDVELEFEKLVEETVKGLAQPSDVKASVLNMDGGSCSVGRKREALWKREECVVVAVTPTLKDNVPESKGLPELNRRRRLTLDDEAELTGRFNPPQTTLREPASQPLTPELRFDLHDRHGSIVAEQEPHQKVVARSD